MTTLPAQGRDRLSAKLNRFFHEPEIPFGMALVRILLPWAIMGALLRRWYYTRELFSTDGAPTPLWESYGYADLLPIPSGTVAVALHTGLLFALVAASLGWRTRLSLVVSFVLYTYLNLLDAVGTITKYSCIASHALLLLSLSECGSLWSLDAWLKNRRTDRSAWPGRVEYQRSSAWPRRLLQLMVGIVYFSAAVTKMHTPAFFSGDQLSSWLITRVNFDHPLGELLAMYPLLVIVSGYVTAVWELMFVFLAYRGWSRTVMIGVGIVFHLATTLTLGLYVFPAICLSLYFAFLDEDDIRKLAWHFRRLQRRWSWLKPAAARAPQPAAGRFTLGIPSGAVHACVLVAIAAGGVGLEHWLDPYGIRRPEGPYTLRALDPAYVQTLTTPAVPLRDVDKFFSLNVGTSLVGGVLLDRRTEFQQGEALVAQCQVSPPHEDMWVECNLHDDQDRMIDRSAAIVTREDLRASFSYRLTAALQPGEYYLVLKKAGREITRRQIVLTAGPQPRVAGLAAPVAN